MPNRAIGLLPDVDVPILRELPAEGTKMGLKPMGATVKYLMRKNPEWGLDSYELAGRLKGLHFLKLVVPVTLVPAGSGLGWQRTKAGDDVVGRYS